MIGRPPRSPLFPYSTLFRSIRDRWHHAAPVPDERFHQRPYERPPDATELALVRHGAAAGAGPGRRRAGPRGGAPAPRGGGGGGGGGGPFGLVEGQGAPPLAPEGVEQAALVARWLA